MKFGSVCSGIEAASVAFEPLGWKAAWFSEIEPFPCAVLKHHYPDTPNHGDMTTLPERIRSGEVEAPDLFCGGTPCQAFSVAGLRQSLADDRGNLSLTFCEIANAIDDVRLGRGESPAVIFWENVPGVLSTQDNAFGCFLGALSGCDTPISPGRLGWTDAGVVAGPQRTVSWRVLDAQYFGLAQRRRRVFVVASARDGFNPAEVLLEWQGVRRDSAPSREAGQRPAPCVTSGSPFSRTGNERVECEAIVPQPSWWDGGQVAATMTTRSADQDMPDKANFQAVLQPVTHSLRGEDFDVAGALCARTGQSISVQDAAQNHLLSVTHSLRGEGFDASEDGTGRGTPLDPVVMRESGQGYWMEDKIAGTLRAEGEDRPSRPSHVIGVPVAFHPTQDPISSQDICHAIGANENATAAVAFGFDGDVMKDGLMETMTTREGAISDTAHAVMQPVAIQGNLIGREVGGPQGIGASQDGVMYTLTKMDVHGVAQPIAIQDVRGVEKAQNGRGWNDDGTAYTVDTHATQGVCQPIAFAQNTRDEVRLVGGDGQIVGALAAEAGMKQTSYVAQPIAWDEELNASVDQAGTLLRGGQGGRHDGVAVGFDSYNHAVTGAVSKTLDAGQDYHHVPNLFQAMQVRRLTPVECERLQGFPDGYTAIPWRGKPTEECPDGPRYKALGNSWAVPCVQWIGRRIQQEVQGKVPS